VVVDLNQVALLAANGHDSPALAGKCLEIKMRAAMTALNAKKGMHPQTPGRKRPPQHAT
jgi:hypothetical protein